MPDFVFQQAAHATKGSGRREPGDRLLLSGRRGAVVQVKARTITPKPDAQERGSRRSPTTRIGTQCRCRITIGEPARDCTEPGRSAHDERLQRLNVPPARTG
ncbi:hypothetical protein ACFVUH_35570 [Kitasatospora sp. NPDC058032]|uniref:hypothetical protein n=1 Tax=Kitasatospora sp. NPDC058032 TaxID=3346307 RepID=UPI0036DD0DAE